MTESDPADEMLSGLCTNAKWISNKIFATWFVMVAYTGHRLNYPKYHHTLSMLSVSSFFFFIQICELLFLFYRVQGLVTFIDNFRLDYG